MKVLVAIEDKVFGDAIIKYIGTQTWALGTEFRLVHVIDTNSIMDCEMLGELACPEAIAFIDVEKAAVKDLLMDMDLRLLKVVPNATTEQRIECGSPKERLIEQVETWHADLLIVGSHGRTGITRFLMGSVSMALASYAPCCVLIVKLPMQTKNLASEMQAVAVK
jgi:nucleotide-binding universal stress UspA family protein